MTLTVADIDRWSAEAVRAVFHAAGARGQATLEVSRQLSSLAVFDSWEGATAEARKHTNASIRQDLDAHGNEALAVARAAGKAADGIERVHSELRTLRHDAAELHMTIDPPVYVFYGINGYDLEAPADDAYNLVIAVAAGQLDYRASGKQLAQWGKP